MTYRTFDGTSQTETIVDGRFSSDGTQYLADSEKINLGTDEDIKIYHGGDHAFIENTTGDFLIRNSAGNEIKIQAVSGNQSIVANAGGSVDLHHDGSGTPHFQTTGSGAKVTGALVVNNSGYDALIVKNTDDGADGTYLTLFNDSASPAVDDVLGLINFKGRDLGGSETTYANIRAISTNVTDTSESGELSFRTRHNNTFAERLKIKSDGVVVVRAPAGSAATLELHGDNSLQNPDLFRLTGKDGVSTWENYGSGSWVENIICNASGTVELHNDGSKKFETNSSGTKTTGGHIMTDGGTLTGGDLSFATNSKAKFGDANDLQIYHSGAHSFIKDSGTGAIKIVGDDIRIENASDRNVFKTTGTACELFFDTGSATSKKLETTTDGVSVTGTGSYTFNSDELNSATGLFINNTATATNKQASLSFSTDSGNRKKSAIAHIDTGNYGTGKLVFALDPDADDGEVNIATHEVLTLKPDKSATFAGKIVVGAGTGIEFGGAAGAAGMTSQVLDDYEEGTFTPAAVSPASGTIANTGSCYTKIGRLVIATYHIGVSSGNASPAKISLPFTAGGKTNSAVGGMVTEHNYADVAISAAVDGTNYLRFIKNGGNSTRYDMDDFNGNELRFTVWYMTE